MGVVGHSKVVVDGFKVVNGGYSFRCFCVSFLASLNCGTYQKTQVPPLSLSLSLLSFTQCPKNTKENQLIIVNCCPKP